MAENVKSISIDSDKAALGRKLLSKHQKGKAARGKSHNDPITEQPNTSLSPNNKVANETIDLVVTSQTLTTEQEMPLQQYFNIPIEHSTPVESELSFFDYNSVALDDPELKHNEIYNLHQINDANDVLKTQQLEDAISAQNVAESSPKYDDYSQMDILQAKHQLAIDSLQSQLQAQVVRNSHLLCENSQLQGELNKYSNEIVELKQHIESSETRMGEYQRQVEVSKGLVDELQAKEQLLVNSARKERDVALQDGSELLERLNHAQKDSERGKQVISQLREQLDMANIKIQQFSTATNTTADVSNDKLVDNQLAAADMALVLAEVRSERDAAAQQYQQYNSQLNEQLIALQGDALALRSHNEQLLGRERDLVAHIGDMERLLQCSEHNITAGAVPDGTARAELEQQCKVLQERVQETRAERDEALRELQVLHTSAQELEELRNAQLVDRTAQAKLLAEIRSDKVAASRAIEQNLTLKKQVAEMESAYLSVTQDKVAPLTDQLATAKHQLHTYQRNLHTLQSAIIAKDNELQQLRVYEAQVPQLTDRLRHYEAAHRHTPLPRDSNEEGGACAHSSERTKEDELQQEIFQLKQELDQVRQAHADLAMLQDGTDDDSCNQTRHLSKANATQQLEHKFTRTMGELAALNDEKQRLEHLVQQLQGETETIGEYVALYQRQRSLLADRAASRELQLRHLQRRLAELVRTLEQGAINEGVVLELVREIGATSGDLMRHGADGDVEGRVGGGVVCGRGCAWCQGEMMTV